MGRRALSTNEVVFDEILCELKGGRRHVLQRLQLSLGRLAVVKPEVVARLQVDGDGAVGELLQVHRQHFLCTYSNASAATCTSTID